VHKHGVAGRVAVASRGRAVGKKQGLATCWARPAQSTGRYSTLLGLAALQGSARTAGRGPTFAGSP